MSIVVEYYGDVWYGCRVGNLAHEFELYKFSMKFKLRAKALKLVMSLRLTLDKGM